jgi:hypothetical protein
MENPSSFRILFRKYEVYASLIALECEAKKIKCTGLADFCTAYLILKRVRGPDGGGYSVNHRSKD